MAFLFDDSLIPSGPSSMLKHHDLMPAKPAESKGPVHHQASRHPQATHATHGHQAEWQPSLQNDSASRPSGRRPQRGHVRSGSVDSCIDAAIPVAHQGNRTGGGARAYLPVPRHGSKGQARAEHRSGGHGRRHSADMGQVGAIFQPGNQGITLSADTTRQKGATHIQPPSRKQTAPTSFPGIPGKKPSRAGAGAPSLPMPRRKGSAGRPTQVNKDHTATAGSSRTNGQRCLKPLSPIKASPTQASAIGRLCPAPTAYVPTKKAASAVTPHSETYTSTFSSSPYPYTAHTPHSGSTCPDTASTSSSSDSAASSDTSATARPSLSASDLLDVSELPEEFSVRLSHLVPAQRRIEAPVPRGKVHVPSLLLALGYLLEILVFERTQLRSPSSTSGGQSVSPKTVKGVPPPLSARRTLVCPHTQSLLWRLIAQHLASLSTLLIPLLNSLQGATYSRQVERCVEGARAYILKIRKVFGEVVGLYAEQYTFVQGWWDERWIKEAAAEIGGWCEVLGA